MITVTVKALKTATEYADEFDRSQLFQSKALRDEVYRILKKRGYKVRRRATGPQSIHPEYVTDYVGEVETGFGNVQYRTYFGNLYAIDTDWRLS